MATKSSKYWQAVKRLRKLCKQKRRAIALKRLPLIREYCKITGIQMLKTEHGYQFRKAEYILNWALPSNKIHIQYALPGHSHTVAFMGKGTQNKPKILVALEEIAELVRANMRP